jgi:hypothetical protein
MGGWAVVEACRSLDVNRLDSADCLVPGWTGTWQWHQDGKRVGRITMHALKLSQKAAQYMSSTVRELDRLANKYYR